MNEPYQVYPIGWILKKDNDVRIDIKCHIPDTIDAATVETPDWVK